MLPPGMIFSLTYGRMSNESPFRTLGSTDDTTSRTKPTMVDFHFSAKERVVVFVGDDDDVCFSLVVLLFTPKHGELFTS